MLQEKMVLLSCFPPHCTHKLQPLDVGFMGPLNSSFGKEIAFLQRQNIAVNLQNLFSVFGKSFIKAAKMETAINAFRKCGISPFNAEIFSELDFAPSRINHPPIPSTINNSDKLNLLKPFTIIILFICLKLQSQKKQKLQNAVTFFKK